MVNLIAGREVVPELVQYDFTSHKVVAKLHEVLPDGPARTKMLEGLASVKTHLHGPEGGQVCPSDRAAEAILALLPAR
jgi:lipid-A-disaccharide synthase